MTVSLVFEVKLVGAGIDCPHRRKKGDCAERALAETPALFSKVREVNAFPYKVDRGNEVGNGLEVQHT